MTISTSTALEVVRTLEQHFKVEVRGRARDTGPSAQRFGSQVSLRRAEAMFVLRRFGMTFDAIGRLFKRDHTTVIAACRRVEAKIFNVVGYGQEVLVLEDMANGVVKMIEERTGRRKLLDERTGLTLHFVITTKNEAGDGTVDIDGYLTTGTYEDGRLGEIFIKVGKAGDAAAWCDQWATMFSIALQHGASLELLCSKGTRTCFEPSGATNVPGIPLCSSPVDLVCKWIAMKYGRGAER